MTRTFKAPGRRHIALAEKEQNSPPIPIEENVFDKITMHRDPFTLECFRKLHLLVEATREMLSADCPADSLQTLYAKTYWQSRNKKPFGSPAIREVIRHRLNLVRSIRDFGLDEERWQTAKLHEKFSYTKGFGPIMVSIAADSSLQFHDGTHRAVILHCLGRPITAHVFNRHQNWQQMKECDQPLYSFHPHPDLDGAGARRTDANRYYAISDALHEAGLNGPLLVIGGCSGFGPAMLSGRGFIVDAVEQNKLRSELANAWAKAAALRFISHPVTLDAFSIRPTIETAVGVGVWHHLATDHANLTRRIRKIACYRAAVVELPSVNAGPWCVEFAPQCKNKEAEVYRMFVEVGGFVNRKLIFTDAEYGQRKTYLLTK